MGQKASKGVMITTSYYTKDAQAYVEKIEKKIVLIDGPRLAELMMDFGIGVTEVASYFDQAPRQRLLRGRRGPVARRSDAVAQQLAPDDVLRDDADEHLTDVCRAGSHDLQQPVPGEDP